MKLSHAEHQKQLDDDADLASRMESIKEEMREELLDGGYYALEYMDGWRRTEVVYDRDNVVEEMIDLDGDIFNAAVLMATKDPIESAKALASLVAPAVEQVIGQAKIREAAEYQIQTKDQAA